MSDASGEQAPPLPRTSPPGGAPESPVALIMVGLFVSVVLGGLLVLAGSAGDVGLLVVLGYLAAVIGSALAAVGIIAAGVRLGLRWARYDGSL